MMDEDQPNILHLPSCQVLEEIKVYLKIDGDVAAFINNACTFAASVMSEEEAYMLGLHDHMKPKLHDALAHIRERVNVYERVEDENGQN